MKIIVKSIRPHRQKILTEDGEEKRLQQWANRKAADALREQGKDTSGDQFTSAREALMREAVSNPEKYGISFIDGEGVPFEGQDLMQDAHEEQGKLHALQEESTHGLDEGEIDRSGPAGLKPNLEDLMREAKEKYPIPTSEELAEMKKVTDKPGFATMEEGSLPLDEDGDMHDEALADWDARQGDIDFSRKEGHTEGHEGKPHHEIEQEELDADKESFYSQFPHLKPTLDEDEDDDREPGLMSLHKQKEAIIKVNAFNDAMLFLKSI